MSEAIGIDLGTTYSCVGIYRDGKVDIFSNEMGNKTTPSIIAYTDKDKVLVGEEAKNQAPQNPQNTVYGVKRMIGRTYKDPILQRDIAQWPFQVIKGPGDRPQIRVQKKGKSQDLFPEQVSAEVLKYLANVAKEQLGHPVKDAVITVPAYFNDAQRSSTKEAGRLAGLNVLRIIPEPTAAAIAFGISTSEEHIPLIFDVGGGTFDVTILHIEDGVYEVKSILGDAHLGGEDFDNEMVKFVAKRFNEKNGCDVTTNQRAMILLKQRCEEAKRILSVGKSTTIQIDNFFNGNDLNETIKRTDFNEINKVHFDKLMPIVREALANSGYDKDDITDLLLVGGSSRIPYVVELLKKEFPNLTPCSSVHPDEAVSIGATIHAYNIIHEDDEDDEDGSIILCDAAPHSRGLEVQGQKLEPLIRQNDAIPTSVTKQFTTTYDNQDKVNIIVFEGEHFENTSHPDNHFMGQFLIEDLPRKKKGEVKIDVNFTLDQESLLHVTATVNGSTVTRVIRTSDEYAPGEPMRKLVEESSTTAVDLLFCLDATGSMGDWLNACVEKCEAILSTAKKDHPGVDFRFGAVFYRDPIDVPTDENVFFDLTNNVGQLRTKMKTQKPYGGGDVPEDWVGCYDIVFHQISWRKNASRAVIHMADAPAHGEEWGMKDKHPDQGKLLPPLIRQLAKEDIFFQGIMVHPCCETSYKKIGEIYRSEGKGTKAKYIKFDKNKNDNASDFLETVAREVLLEIAPA